MNFKTVAQDKELVGLEDLQWKHRVLLVFAREPLMSNALTNLQELEAGTEDRDMIWFVLDGHSMHSNYTGSRDSQLRERLIKRYFTPEPEETAILLIGKDGSVKARSSDLDLEATFDLIDQMPMRRAELNRQSEDAE